MRAAGVLRTLLLYGAFALMLWLATDHAMPLLQENGMRPDISWFVAGGAVMAALLIATAASLKKERSGSGWRERLRIHRLSAAHWKLCASGFVMAAAGSAGLLLLLRAWVPGFSPHPRFLAPRVLAPSEYWVLLAWLPMFFLNIAGEELFGRGYLLPRNELSFGNRAWLVNALGWLVFHAAFGTALMLLTAPIILAVAWATQKSGNTSVGIVIHALANGPAFVLLSLGLLPGAF